MPHRKYGTLPDLGEEIAVYPSDEDLDVFTRDDLRQQHRRELRMRKGRRSDIHVMDRKGKRTKVGIKRKVVDYLLFDDGDEFDFN